MIRVTIDFDIRCMLYLQIIRLGNSRDYLQLGGGRRDISRRDSDITTIIYEMTRE